MVLMGGGNWCCSRKGVKGNEGCKVSFLFFFSRSTKSMMGSFFFVWFEWGFWYVFLGKIIFRGKGLKGFGG